MSNLQCEKLRISLKSYESPLLDQSCQKILEAINTSGLKAVGPVPLPTKIRRYCVLTSPHVNKDAREHFEIRIHKRLLDIYTPQNVENIADSFLKIAIPPGVSIKLS